MTHLDAERIGTTSLTEAERRHLDECPMCQAERALQEEFLSLLPDPVATRSGPLVDVPFAVLRWLGAGPRAVVYEALDGDGARVALKVFSTPPLKLELPRHPNLARRHDASLTSTPPWITGELIRGPTLLECADDLSTGAAAAALRQVWDGLCALHDRGIAHGNVGPTNVIVENSGRVVLLDAGQTPGVADDDVDRFRVLVATVARIVASEELRSVAVAPPDAVREALVQLEASDLGRYADRGLLGRGGMGEVRRVFDPTLERPAALKSLNDTLTGSEEAARRLLQEARLQAGLQHPGIVPVHEMGRLPDGRPYYTMMEVQGTTLAREIALHHDDGADRIHRLIRVFLSTVETVAFAHSRGVVHCDLKPQNVMLGEFGEVRVLDWGLARSGGRAPSTEVSATGSLSGTAAYMAPEQARGEASAVGPHTDIYALGAILYQILAGRPPYVGPDVETVIRSVLEGPPPTPRAAPPALVAIQRRAMEASPQDRFADARAMADAVRDWLEGARRRERALELVAQADARRTEASPMRARVDALRAEAETALAETASFAPIEAKSAAWALQDQAATLELEADQAEREALRSYQAALLEDPALPEAHDRLADHYASAHRAAEARRDSRAARHFEQLLLQHDRGRYEAYLDGTGRLTLHTDPPGVRATLFRYVEERRRLVPKRVRDLGRTPLDAVVLDRGSWLVRLETDGLPAVDYPVWIRRGEHWDGVRPGSVAPFPIAMGAPGGGRLVPAGWFAAGSDNRQGGAVAPQRVWVDSFVIQEHAVTNADWLVFLNALLAADREEEALRHVPRERGSSAERGAMIYGRTSEGFALAADADGHVWQPNWPVVYIDFDSARAYARWRAERDGLPWRLPFELEWEKAARGVDGRDYPWGDFFDATFCNCRESAPAGQNLLGPVGGFEVDRSPYGVAGMAGNARNRCADRYDRDGPRVENGIAITTFEAGEGLRTLRGGSWADQSIQTRSPGRTAVHPTVRGGRAGLRLAYTLEARDPDARAERPEPAR